MPLSFTEKKRIRYSFGKIGKTIEVPNLVDIQKISFDKFLQLGKSVEERSNTGLQEVFNSVFPIKDYAGKSELHYIDYYLDNPCLLYTSPSPRDGLLPRMPSSA